MSDFESTALPLPSQENSGSPNGSQEVRWKVVAQAPGITPATIIAGRLQAEGVPVRVWQEAAGQALGLTVGLLGTGHVLVPEEYVERWKYWPMKPVHLKRKRHLKISMSQNGTTKSEAVKPIK